MKLENASRRIITAQMEKDAEKKAAGKKAADKAKRESDRAARGMMTEQEKDEAKNARRALKLQKRHAKQANAQFDTLNAICTRYAADLWQTAQTNCRAYGYTSAAAVRDALKSEVFAHYASFADACPIKSGGEPIPTIWLSQERAALINKGLQNGQKLLPLFGAKRVHEITAVRYEYVKDAKGAKKRDKSTGAYVTIKVEYTENEDVFPYQKPRYKKEDAAAAWLRICEKANSYYRAAALHSKFAKENADIEK